MGGKRDPQWAVLMGGPLDGRQELLTGGRSTGSLVLYTPSAAEGMHVPHEYALTGERRKRELHRGSDIVARFVRTLPEECKPPPADPLAHLARVPAPREHDQDPPPISALLWARLRRCDPHCTISFQRLPPSGDSAWHGRAVRVWVATIRKDGVEYAERAQADHPALGDAVAMAVRQADSRGWLK